MSKRKSAGAAVVEFFQTAPIGTAEEILGICKNTIALRLKGEAPVVRTVSRRVVKPAENQQPAERPAEGAR